MSTTTERPTDPSQQTHQSRWGFHPCDRETYLALKEFHRLTLRDRRMTRARERWLTKLPHNRVRLNRDGTRTPTPEPQALGTDGPSYAWVLAEYQNARRPQSTPEAVRSLDLPQGWAKRSDELAAFYAGH
jgi:hypothetical protein